MVVVLHRVATSNPNQAVDLLKVVGVGLQEAVQRYLAHKQPSTPLGPMPRVPGGWAFFHERGTHVDLRRHVLDPEWIEC